MSDVSLRDAIKEHLTFRRIPFHVDETGNICVANGEMINHIKIVAHDTEASVVGNMMQCYHSINFYKPDSFFDLDNRLFICTNSVCERCRYNQPEWAGVAKTVKNLSTSMQQAVAESCLVTAKQGVKALAKLIGL